MRTTSTFALVLGTSLVLAACARREEPLPPPPPPAQPVAPPTTTDPGVGTQPVMPSQVPGSQADFIAQSGSDRVLFAFDSYSLDAEARDILGRQAEWLNRYPNVRITIEGHADERGTREYNLALGERRANAARTFLAAQGVSSNRMNVISYGKERPAVDGSNESAWAQNRRAVTVLVSGFVQ
ncbi:MAG: peptidoglycan-associated lipoprotein Pal [Thermaurantiacus sp.]